MNDEELAFLAQFQAMPLGAKLAQIRVDKDLSQGDIARATGFDRSYISQIENGREPSERAVALIATALGLSEAELNILKGEVSVDDLARVAELGGVIKRMFSYVPQEVADEVTASFGADPSELLLWWLEMQGKLSEAPPAVVEPPDGWADLNGENRRLITQLIAKLLQSQSISTPEQQEGGD